MLGLKDNRDISSSSEILDSSACNHLATKRDAVALQLGVLDILVIDFSLSGCR